MAEKDPRRWLALVLLCASQFVVVLDVAIVNVALPSIKVDLGFSQGGLQWIVSAYTLTFGGLLLLGGRSADLLGRRRVFLGGMVLFGAASLVCGLAWSPAVLIAARAVQGIGAAVISPAALSILTTTFDEGAERNKALGIWGAIGGAGAAAGVLLGGILTEWAGWEWIFFVNVPVAAGVLALGPRLLRESRADGMARRFDALGALTVTAALALLVYAVVETDSRGWGSAATIALLAVSAALGVAFVAIERRADQPLVPLRIFRLRTLTAANVVGFTLGATVFALFFVLSLYMQQVLGWSALKTGVAYLATAGTVILVAGASQALVTRIGVKPVLVVGMTLLTLALLWYLRLPVQGHYAADLLPSFLVTALGMGFAFIPIAIAALAGVAPRDAGLASGLINTSQQIGGAIGIAIVSTVAIDRTTSLRRAGVDAPAALTSGFHWAFAVAAAFAAVGALAALLLIRRREVAVAAVPLPEVAG